MFYQALARLRWACVHAGFVLLASLLAACGGGGGGGSSGSDMTPLGASISAVTPVRPMIGQDISFTAQAVGGSSGFSYAWDFGDGESGSGSSPTHAYKQPGNFLIRLTVFDSSGHAATASTTVVVT